MSIKICPSSGSAVYNWLMLKMERQRTSGMSLVEVMMALGISTMVILGVMSMMTYTQKAAKGVSITTDWTSLKSSIFQAITNFTVCDAIISRLGDKYKITLSAEKNFDYEHAAELPELIYTVGPAEQKLVEKNKSVNGLVISGIKLWAITPPEPMTDIATTLNYTKYTVRMQLDAERDKALAGSGQVMKLQPYHVDFKIIVGPDTREVPWIENELKGCVPIQ